MNPSLTRLADCAYREIVELIRIDLPDEQAECLLERGVVPGCSLCAVRCSPTGDPIVQIDGMLLAMRREMAGCLFVRRAAAAAVQAETPGTRRVPAARPAYQPGAGARSA